MLIEYMKTDFEFINDSGSLVQLVHGGWNQVNVIISKPGKIRGGHYHKFNDECFYVINGTFELIVWNDQCEENYIMKSGDMFKIGPNVYHTFKYIEETLLVSMYSNGVELDDDTKDIWT